MAKVKTIQEKRIEMERQLERLGAFETILGKLEDHIKWEFGIIKRDENGDSLVDESGDYIYVYPTKDDWNYERYKVFVSAVDEVKALVQKALI